MIDLNDLRVFERVAALQGFSAAARALGLPKSSVSRSIQRLEGELSTRLLQRTTREVVLTESGRVLHERCAELLGQLAHTVDFVSSLHDGPRGCLRVSTGIGFGIAVLTDLLPDFLLRYPKIDIVLDLSSAPQDLVSERIDVAFRLGRMPDSQIVARRLGTLHRYVCVSPDYLTRRGMPCSIDDLHDHDLIDMTFADGRKSDWNFVKGDETIIHRQTPRIEVNDPLAIYKLILKGGGIGLVSGFLCAPDLQSGRLVRLFSDWTMPSVEVHAVFPSQRELAPAVRVFIDYMREHSRMGHHWQDDPMASLS